KLLVVVWQVLTHQAADCQADVAMVARKLQRWGKSRSLATQHGLSSVAFARQHLRRLGLDLSLEGVAGRETSGGAPAPPPRPRPLSIRPVTLRCSARSLLQALLVGAVSLCPQRGTGVTFRLLLTTGQHRCGP